MENGILGTLKCTILGYEAENETKPVFVTEQ